MQVFISCKYDTYTSNETWDVGHTVTSLDMQLVGIECVLCS